MKMLAKTDDQLKEISASHKELATAHRDLAAAQKRTEQNLDRLIAAQRRGSNGQKR